MTTGEKIRSARQEAKLTQKRVAELSGIAEPTIRKYESNRLNPKIGTLKKLANAIGCDVMELLDGLDEKGNDAIQRGVLDTLDNKIAEEKREKHIATITALFAQLNRHGREKVISYAEGLVESPDYRADLGGD